MASPDPIFERAVAMWRGRGIPLMPPATAAEIVRLFADLGHPLSADVRALYATVGGFADGEMDELWSFWPLDQVREENSGGGRPFVMFADYLIHSHIYCFHYESTRTSSVFISHDGETLEEEPVAASVAEFLEKLLCDPNEVGAWRMAW
jgi:hypothetical protein